jgi:hypothetical protein
MKFLIKPVLNIQKILFKNSLYEDPRKWWDQKTLQEKKMDDFYRATNEE